MPSFGRTSTDRLNTCHNSLQRLFEEVVKHFDCSIICGHRGEERQTRYFNEGKSKVKFPNSKHNSYPSLAVDVAPYIDSSVCWDKDQLYFFAGYVKGVADKMGVQIRLGADWDGDGNIKDQSFVDRPHFEIID